MLQSVKIVDKSKTPIRYVSYAKNIFDNGEEFKFKPGINIIIGPNGSGKSTLLELISQYLFCEKRMFTDFSNRKAIWEFPNLWNDKGEVLDGVEVKYDYQSIIFRLRPVSDFETEEANINKQSFSLFINSGSASFGEKTLEALGTLFNLFSNKEINFNFPLKEIKKEIECSNDVFKTRFENLLKYYQNNRIKITQEDFQYTVLLDEPDRNLDISNIQNIYNILSFKKEYTQLIAVVHNPILIYKLSKLDYINFVEMKEGYLNEVKEVFKNL